MAALNPEDSLSDLELRLSLLEIENDQLRALNGRQLVEIGNLRTDRTQLLRLASATAKALQLQQGPIQPEGIWVKEEEEGRFEEILRAAKQEEKEEKGARWLWKRISPTLSVNLPNFGSNALAPVDLAPFTFSFPLELFEAIVSHCDPPTTYAIARCSFACLQLFLPLLYTEFTLFSEKEIRQVFCSRDSSSSSSTSSRLAPVLSLAHVKTLRLYASALVDLGRAPTLLPRDRLDKGKELHLDHLEIIMDMDPYQTELTNDDGFSDEESDEDEEERNATVPRILTFSYDLLSLLNPKKLTIRTLPRILNEDDDLPAYHLHNSTAIAFSQWTRLSSLRLHSVDLYCTENNRRPFNDTEVKSIIGFGGMVPFQSKEGVEVTLDLCRLPSKVTMHDLLSTILFVLTRDLAFRVPSVKVVRVVVKGGGELEKKLRLLFNDPECGITEKVRLVVRTTASAKKTKK